MTMLVGQTIRATASVLTDAAGVALVSPTVTISIKDAAEAVTTGTVVQSGSTYYAEFTPTVGGKYVVRAAATAGGSTWKEEESIYIHAAS